jgi:hypothetical protein
MVIMDSKNILKYLDNFDPTKVENIDVIKKMIVDYPYFLITQIFYLKFLKYNNPEEFALNLKRISISTYDRALLYDWINLPLKKIKFDENKNKSSNEQNMMHFIDWVQFISEKTSSNKKIIPIQKKFDLIDAFIEKPPSFKNNSKNKIDLSKISLTSSDELMTETLAKVFTKQKKYKKAIQAYKILILKYPEKKSFFADKIKKINKLEKN